MSLFLGEGGKYFFVNCARFFGTNLPVSGHNRTSFKCQKFRTSGWPVRRFTTTNSPKSWGGVTTHHPLSRSPRSTKLFATLLPITRIMQTLQKSSFITTAEKLREKEKNKYGKYSTFFYATDMLSDARAAMNNKQFFLASSPPQYFPDFWSIFLACFWQLYQISWHFNVCRRAVTLYVNKHSHFNLTHAAHFGGKTHRHVIGSKSKQTVINFCYHVLRVSMKMLDAYFHITAKRNQHATGEN